MTEQELRRKLLSELITALQDESIEPEIREVMLTIVNQLEQLKEPSLRI
jgi:hypothetical protein